jgi:adenosylcobinamide-phosphate synthase
VWGAALTAGLSLAAATASGIVARLCRRAGVAGIMLEAVLLKPSFALGGLLSAGDAVREALEGGNLVCARDLLHALVSRDTAGLDEALVAAAAIESLAENLTDSVLAPWVAYAAAGLPGAYVYRAVNTLDSMIGYRGRYEHLGKIAARLDDVLNLLPARAGAVLLAMCAPLGRGSVGAAARVASAHHGRTASPNAGWTMAAMAGALGVRLTKVGAYTLGDGREPNARDIHAARRIILGAAGVALAVLTVIGGVRDG